MGSVNKRLHPMHRHRLFGATTAPAYIAPSSRTESRRFEALTSRAASCVVRAGVGSDQRISRNRIAMTIRTLRAEKGV